MAKKLFWIDLEMTGLDEKVHHIIEVAAIITDLDFKTIDTFHKVVFQPQEVLDGMDDWCKKTHGESGLVAQIPKGMPLKDVESALIEFIDPHFEKNERIPIAGNSVGNDQRFIDAYLPEFSKRLHYRIIDVSSFKEIFKSKWGVEFKKQNTHRALDDIEESIRELQTYLSFVDESKITSGKNENGN